MERGPRSACFSRVGGAVSSGFSHEDRISETVTWLTPPWIIDSLGPFDLDPCAHPGNQTANRKIVLPDCGLAAEWSGRVWCNPPYGLGIQKWLEKLANHGDGIALVFARTDTKWFHSVSNRASALLFLRNRIKFMKPDLSVGMQATAPSMFLAFGKECADRLLESQLDGWRVRQ